MNCPACGMPDAVTVRLVFGRTVDKRGRRCKPCGAQWTTIERLERGTLRAGEIPKNGGGENGSSGGPGQPAELVRGMSSSGSSSSLFPLSDPPKKDFEDTKPKRGRGRPSTGEYTPGFLEFWDGLSVRRGNKRPAFISFVKIENRISPKAAIARWELWLTTDQWRRGFIPHVATWLNKGGWEHDPDPSEFSAGGAPTTQQAMVDSGKRFLERHKGAA